MCDFNNLTDEEQLHYHTILITAANNYGGVNFFLQLLEALREASPHPLTSRHQDFLFDLGNIRWGKTIFQDKVLLIKERRLSSTKEESFLPKVDEKKHKKILNLIRTLDPITFSVRPHLRDVGEGFDFKAFETKGDIIKLNPLFEALFFCSVDTVKKILNHKA
jgi:hypothetical protein